MPRHDRQPASPADRLAADAMYVPPRLARVELEEGTLFTVAGIAVNSTQNGAPKGA